MAGRRTHPHRTRARRRDGRDRGLAAARAGRRPLPRRPGERGRGPPQRAEEHVLTDRAAGALLLRDAGSPADTRWIDERDDLPRIIRAGRHIARPKRYLRNFAAEVEPEDLVAEVERQAARGDGWVKLVGDWIDRDLGDLAPLWPAAVARAGIERAHELGCRVTAHVFGEQALAELVAAGIDGIEHGTGLTEATTALMAERQVALVPTMVQPGELRVLRAGRRGQVPRVCEARPGPYATRIERFAAAREAGVADLRRHGRRRVPAARSGRGGRSRCWLPSAPRSTPWVPGPGGPGPGWAIRRNWPGRSGRSGGLRRRSPGRTWPCSVTPRG